MSERTALAIDLGASSGRVLAGSFNGQTVRLEEVHRFENGPVNMAGTLYWDLPGLWTHIKAGLRASSSRYGDRLLSVGVDTWGVDFALLAGDVPLSNPVHYRDGRTDGILARAFDIVSREEIFAATGLQFLQFNTLFQMLALRESNPTLLEAADTLLLMPDLFHWLLTGEKTNERTNASTTQFYNPATGNWAIDIFDRFGLPTDLLGKITEPGQRIGPLLPEVIADTGLKDVHVVLPGTHDTASAVMAVPSSSPPSDQPNWAYISSGTWALMGVEVPNPVINESCLNFNCTNEGGVGGTTRLLKNICGLWLVQECRRIWAAAGTDHSWDDLIQAADRVPACRSVVDPDDPEFLAPADMPQALADYCRRTSQPVPENVGETIRCALDSIALKSAYVLSMLEQLTGGTIETIHIVGGGTQNTQLCQATANACGRPVLAGPVEATALGNCMMQFIAAGEVADIAQAREVIARSFPLVEYQPTDQSTWREANDRFASLIETR